MRYGRISIDGEIRWVRVDDDAVHVLRSSPLEGDPVVEASRYITFHPGDVLWMGADSTCRLTPGDTVDVEITGIGVLSNPVRLAT